MKRENILIVDDETMVREMMRDVLIAEGYHTTVVDSGLRALEIAQETEFDLLLSDIKMPQMSGLDLVKELRQYNPDLVAILVTGYGSITTARKAIQEGVYDYILKPFDRSELTAAVETALSRKRQANENTRLKWLFGMLQVTQAMATGSEYHQLLDFIVRTATAETRSVGGSIVLFDLAIHGVTIAAAVGRWDYAAQIANTILKNGVTSFETEMGKCVLLTDNDQHPLFGQAQHHRLDSNPWGLDLKDVEVLLLAIEADKETTGILSICRESGQRPLSEGDLEMLTVLAAEASIAVKNYRSLAKVEGDALTCLRSIASRVDGKSVHLKGHMERVASLSRQLAIKLGLSTDEVAVLSLAASLHDLGKIGVDEAILNKAGELSPEEAHLARRHPLIADEIMAPLQFLDEARPIIRHHHEQPDGEGYPDGLSGPQITPAMHVLILANAYDNLTSGSARKPAIDRNEAILRLQDGKGSSFDARMTDSFVAMIEASENHS